jgi:eukaryotic-like serine/threonine-protein kinase
MQVGKEIGPFIIERELGSGSMGSVYLAHFKDKPGQRVALKFVGVGISVSQKALDRFEREAEILKQLRHPNIVRLIGHGRHQKKHPYYAMEYVEGQTLSEVLSRRGRLPWEEVVALGKQLCAALQHAHEQGIIHRDVKPSNLMVLRDGTLKLTDFGIAKDLDVTALTEANCTVGTASYMSPEQCKGERNLTHRSDLYSLGIVLYELLTGKKPFEADGAMEMFLLHVQGKFERPSRLVMDIPSWLDTLVCQLLEKKSDKRPFDAVMVGAALDQIVEKVTAQRSAGVDALTSGTVTGAIQSSRTLVGADREAARTLAQGLGKSKKRRKKPLYKRAWFQALGIGLALLIFGGLIVFAVQPQSPDLLYEQAKQRMESGDQAKKDRARDDFIAKYLKFHSKKMAGTDQLKQVEAWADEVDTERRETVLLNGIKWNLTPESGPESAARKAITQEGAGEFNDAVATWQDVAKSEGDGDADHRKLALVAKKHLRELKAADDRLLALQQKVDLIRAGQDLKPDSESEKLAVEAMRYEKLGDAALAGRRWQAVRLKNEGDGAERSWFLIAARGAKEQKDKAPKASEEQAERSKLLKARLDEAEKLATEGKKARALRIAYEVQILYKDDPKMSDKVERAQEIIKENGGG